MIIVGIYQNRGVEGSFDDLITAYEPLHWWKLNESSGLTAVDAEGNRNGEYLRATLGAPPLRRGTTASAGFLELDAQCFVGASLELGSLFATERSATIAFWYKHVGSTAQNRLFQYFWDTFTGTGPYRVFGATNFDVPNDQKKLTVPMSFYDGDIHFFTVTKSDQGYSLYIDGSLVDSNPSTLGSSVSGGYGFCFPASGGYNHYPVRGYFSDMVVFQKALGAGDVANLYTSGVLGSAPEIPDTDPYWSSVSLLLPMSGEDGDTVFTDLSSIPKSVSAYGNAKISSERSKFGATSGKFDGAGDYLLVTPNSAGDLGTGDFTIELWFCLSEYPSSGSYVVLLDKQVSLSSRYTLYLGNNTSGDNGLRFGVNGHALCGTETGTNGSLDSLGYQLNSWYHAAVVRKSGLLTLYLNGIAMPLQSTDTSDLTYSNPLCIGAFAGGSDFFLKGFCCQLRLTPGIARYSGPFTPPQKEYPIHGDPYWPNVVSLLHFDDLDNSTVFSDEKDLIWTSSGNARLSTANKVFGASSYSGDGDNDYIRATSAGFAFGTGDFTIEFRINQVGQTVAGVNAANCLLDMRTAEPSSAILLDSTSIGVLRLYVGGSYRITSNVGVIAGGWHAIALTRESGVTRLFVDGALVGSWVDTTNYTSTTLTLGGRFAAVSGDYRSLNGFIDEFRVTKGIARDVSAVSTEPFPAGQ